MSRTFADEIVETSTTQGTVTYQLGGAKGSYRRFRAGYDDGEDKIYYGVRNALKTKWELHRNAELTYGSPDTLTRNVFLSTNGNAAVAWTAEDMPLTIYVPSAADVLEAVVTGWLNAARHALVRAGAFFWTYSDAAVSWRRKLATDDAAAHEVGTYVVARGAYYPDSRRYWQDVGANNKVLDINDCGKVLAFDCTAAQRTATLLSAATAKDGFWFDIIAYGSTTNGVTITPDGSDALNQAKVAPNARVRVEWDAARSVWRVGAASPPIRTEIYGLTYANNGSDATNDIDVAAGGCWSDDGTEWMEIAATTKQLDVAAAADNGATPSGMLGPAAAIGNNDYALYLIKNPTTGECRVFAEKQDTAPTLPTGFTKKRQFGFIQRTAGAIAAFTTFETAGGGLELWWATPVIDFFHANTLTTTRRTDAIRVPKVFSVLAHVTVQTYDATTGTNVRITRVGETDLAVTTDASNGGSANMGHYPGVLVAMAHISLRTSADGKIAARAQSTVVDQYNCVTNGFTWSRR